MGKMKNVYVVIQGDYGDHHIVACFSDKSTATKFVESTFRTTVKKLRVDSLVNFVIFGQKVYMVSMSKDGEYLRVNSDVDIYSDTSYLIGRCSGIRFYRSDSFVEMKVVAYNEQHAIEIANKKRIEMIDCGIWGINE